MNGEITEENVSSDVGLSSINEAAITRDVFLSHANVDKEKYVRPFAEILAERDITFWLDEAEIMWGHSLLKIISEGLETSRFVLVFLSDEFISRPWPDAELRAALSREISTGEIRVLPIMICEPENVLKRHPFLHDKKWLSWSAGTDRIVEELEKNLGRSFKGRWEFLHPAGYRGHVWIKVLPKYEYVPSRHNFQIKWGRWVYEGHLDFKTTAPQIIEFKKIAEKQAYPIHFQIDPAAFVTAGRGRPLHNIDFSLKWKSTDNSGRIRAMLSKWRQWFLPETD